MSIRGVVSKVSSNQFNGKTLWSLRLQGDNNYYNTGERPPHVHEGASIEFETKLSPSGKHSVLLETIRPWESGGVMQAAPANVIRRSADPKDTYWADKELRDKRNDLLRELGASRNTAIAFIELLVKTEALKLPAKVGDREAVIWDALEHYTKKLMGIKEEAAAEKAATPQEEGEWK